MISPLLGDSSPQIVLKRLVLPEPDAPVIAMKSPSLTFKFNPFKILILRSFLLNDKSTFLIDKNSLISLIVT